MSSSSAGIVSSISIRDERLTIRMPAYTIAPATTSATIESSSSIPVTWIRTRPTITASDVSASARR